LKVGKSSINTNNNSPILKRNGGNSANNSFLCFLSL
jgi:hypothetical protein